MALSPRILPVVVIALAVSACDSTRSTDVNRANGP